MTFTLPDDLLRAARMSEADFRQEVAVLLFRRERLTLAQHLNGRRRCPRDALSGSPTVLAWGEARTVGHLESILNDVDKLSPAERRELADRLAVLEAPVRAIDPTGLHGRIEGCWNPAEAGVPGARPADCPDGALLPRLGERLADGALCLDLALIEGAWYALSKAASTPTPTRRPCFMATRTCSSAPTSNGLKEA